MLFALRCRTMCYPFSPIQIRLPPTTPNWTYRKQNFADERCKCFTVFGRWTTLHTPHLPLSTCHDNTRLIHPFPILFSAFETITYFDLAYLPAPVQVSRFLSLVTHPVFSRVHSFHSKSHIETDQSKSAQLRQCSLRLLLCVATDSRLLFLTNHTPQLQFPFRCILRVRISKTLRTHSFPSATYFTSLHSYDTVLSLLS